MAQILKEELRQAIIASAKEEFLNNGYENASMRNIAKKAKMTVGNLYRYFESKDDIHKHIVNETLEEIDKLLRKLTANNLSMETRVFNLKANINDLRNLMNVLAENLVDIYMRHSTEFNILMMQSNLNNELCEWFSSVISSLIEQHYLIPELKKDKDILSHSYAVSIFNGVKEIFSLADNDDFDSLVRIVKTYLNSYVLLLDNDIRKLV